MAEDQSPPAAGTARQRRPTLARTSLWTADAHELEAFYREVFGFSRIALVDLGGDAIGAAIVRSWRLVAGAHVELRIMRAPRGDGELAIVSAPNQHLGAAASVRDGPPQVGSTYLVLYVPSLDDVLAACEHRGVAFNRERKRIEAADGLIYHEMAIYDPDGRVLLVVEDVAPRAQPMAK